MGRYNVEYNGKWAAFSTIVDNFITLFTDKDEYEKWRKEEYGESYVPIEHTANETIEEITFIIRLNRSHEETLKYLCEAGISEVEAEKILYDVETKHYCPILAKDSDYKCPNCGEVVVKNQVKCTNETCDREFVWR